MRIHGTSTSVILLTALLAFTGCAGTSAPSVSGDVLDVSALAKDFWRVDVPTEKSKGPPAKRIAIVEFTVEYVEDGANFSRSMELELPGVLYQGFVQTLPEFDRYSLALADVSDSAAYARLSGTRLDDVQILPASAGGDVATRRCPVDGLLALDDGDAKTDAAIVDLLDELEADEALQVRLRVGIRDGRASIEKGSSFRGVSRNGQGVLESKLTLISAVNVVETSGDSVAVDSSRFVKAIQRLFRPYIAMALVAAGRPV